MAHYCPDCDPILRATNIICNECKAVSYPLDAEFVSDDFILVTYDRTHLPGCPGRKHSCTALLDGRIDGGGWAWPQRPRSCKGTVRSGRPCRNPAGRASAYCAQHNPARQAAG